MHWELGFDNLKSLQTTKSSSPPLRPATSFIPVSRNRRSGDDDSRCHGQELSMLGRLARPGKEADISRVGVIPLLHYGLSLKDRDTICVAANCVPGLSRFTCLANAATDTSLPSVSIKD